MIDSVLKGTGNSRFLKSAVPAGTSWADALAMLQAGTFPIDFNGINTEGFQQVGTPLNKANLLKDATAAQIGLPPSTTPDGMFRALGNTGELHVWRKTVNVDAVVPTTNTGTTDLSTSGSALRYSKTASISGSTCVISGDIKSMNLPATAQDASSLVGMFVVFSASAISPVYYIVSVSGTTIKYATTQVGKAPTTTYPVSTNPNAYQEGNDAKEAGYTLLEVVMGSFRAGATNYTISYNYEAASELTVSDDGRTVSMTSPSTGSFGFMGGLEPGDNPAKIRAFMLGKFVRCTAKGDQLNEAPDTKYPFNTIPSDIVYIPSNAQITIANGDVLVDRYQPVTGYAAIPAGTTIEYLGKLGDKARVQVVSYVGTGTYGENNPCSLTFDFAPKAVFLFSPETYKKCFVAYGDTNGYLYDDNPDGELNVSWDKKKMSWFQYDSANNQLNLSNYKYRAIAIG